MLGITIHINGRVIYARTAVNRGLCAEHCEGCVAYETDTGAIVHHRPENGAVELARLLLDTIKEQRPSERLANLKDSLRRAQVEPREEMKRHAERRERGWSSSV